MKMNTSKIAMVGVSAIALLMLAFSAQATNLVTNSVNSPCSQMVVGTRSSVTFSGVILLN